jgi:hypothetical protein
MSKKKYFNFLGEVSPMTPSLTLIYLNFLSLMPKIKKRKPKRRLDSRGAVG